MNEYHRHSDFTVLLTTKASGVVKSTKYRKFKILNIRGLKFGPNSKNYLFEWFLLIIFEISYNPEVSMNNFLKWEYQINISWLYIFYCFYSYYKGIYERKGNRGNTIFKRFYMVYSMLNITHSNGGFKRILHKFLSWMTYWMSYTFTIFVPSKQPCSQFCRKINYYVMLRIS